VDKQTYLIVLLSGLIALLGLDLRERFLRRQHHSDTGELRPRSVLFLVGTIVVFGSLHYGGLALVPNAEEILIASQIIVNDFVNTSGDHRSLSVWVIGLVGVATFYFAGLCGYLFHRYVSHSRAMWFTHEHHHLPTDVSVYMPGLFVRPFAVVTFLPTTAITIFAVQLVVGVSGYTAWDMMPLLYTVLLVQVGILGASHSAFLRRLWWVHRMLRPLGITSPQEHWLHHTADLQGNYGNITILWDRVFGTYLDPETIPNHLHRAGLAYDQDFLGTITLGKLKLPRRLRNYFQVERYCYLDPA